MQKTTSSSTLQSVTSNARRKNFTDADKDTFIDILFEYKNDLECKITNKNNNEEKKTAWREITLKFNAQSVIQRAEESLKNLYNNLKADTKKAIAARNRGIMATGGGEQAAGMNQIQLKMASYLGDSIEPLSNSYDSNKTLEAVTNQWAIKVVDQPAESAIPLKKISSVNGIETYEVNDEQEIEVNDEQEIEVISLEDNEGAQAISISRASKSTSDLSLSFKKPNIINKTVSLGEKAIPKPKLSLRSRISRSTDNIQKLTDVKENQFNEKHNMELEIFNLKKKLLLKQIAIAETELEIKKLQLEKEINDNTKDVEPSANKENRI